jgi:hypothetical protein
MEDLYWDTTKQDKNSDYSSNLDFFMKTNKVNLNIT